VLSNNTKSAVTHAEVSSKITSEGG